MIYIDNEYFLDKMCLENHNSFPSYFLTPLNRMGSCRGPRVKTKVFTNWNFTKSDQAFKENLF